ncbi:MAG: hypothetical protein Q8N83_12315 [Ignavibacteria bacterium]|nr:hypothetical protein [Ignavibacteria bacterium]
MTSEFAERLQSQSAEGSWQGAIGRGQLAEGSRLSAGSSWQSAK